MRLIAHLGCGITAVLFVVATWLAEDFTTAGRVAGTATILGIWTLIAVLAEERR